MTVHITEEMMGFVATADLSAPSAKYKVVTIGGTIAASLPQALGVLKYGTSSGGNGSAIYAGVTKAFVGGAVSTVGWPLTVTTSGFLVAATSGQLTCGRAMAVAASGDVAFVAVDFKTLGYSAV